MTTLIKIKPLSVNQAWQGKRYKTVQYKDYEYLLLALLPKMEIPEGALKIDLVFGFSNPNSDWDNPIKPFVDILQKKYGFNDSRILEAHVKKVKVKKGDDYVRFKISEASPLLHES